MKKFPKPWYRPERGVWYVTLHGKQQNLGPNEAEACDRHRRLTERRLNRREVLAMIKKYAKRAGLPSSVCCHTFRATGITSYLIGGGTLERAQQIAAHADASTTKLYDRRDDAITSDEIERIAI